MKLSMNLPELKKPQTRQKGAEISRRDLLRGGAMVATLTLAPGVTLMAYGSKAAASAQASSSSRWGLLIDVSKCKTDCNVCVKACSDENGWLNTGNPETDAQWIRKVDLKDLVTGRQTSLPVMCQHCENPPCVDVCPTGASFKRADGIVLVDKHICIGCRYCMMACPYKARSFIHEDIVEEGRKTWAPRGKGTVEGCTLCVQLVDSGGIPACAQACGKTGNGAILFGDLMDPESEISKRIADYPSVALRDDLGLKPGVRYANL